MCWREKLPLFTKAPISARDRAVLLDAVLSVCQWVNITFLWWPNLPDESDNHLIELAVAGNAEWIVIRVTPRILRQANWFSTASVLSRRVSG